MTRVLTSSLIAGSVLAVAACTSIGVGAGTENETDIRVIDLKLAGAGPFGWFDNETFVVMMNTGERYVRKDGADVLVARVTTINYRTGERKVFGKVSSGLCFSLDRYVSYVFLDRATDELWVSYGQLGKETTRKIKPGELTFDRWSGGSCRPWAERPAVPATWAQGKTEIWPLWPQLGVLNCNGSSSILNRAVKASFHKPDDEAGVELPFSCYDVRRGLRYYAFKGAFFAPEHALVSPWPVGRDRNAYWLFPDGRVETIVLPYSTAIRENMVPTARGIVAFGRPAKRGEEYAVYLVSVDGTRKILPGHAAGVTSPDGCKVAMLHDPEYDARLDRRPVTTRVTLKVLEVCGRN